MQRSYGSGEPQSNDFDGKAEIGEWSGQSSTFYDSGAVTAIEYSSGTDLLWVGYSDGRITSHNMSLIDEHCNQLERFSSFRSGHNFVRQILPLHNRILSLGDEKMLLHTDGGLAMGSISVGIAPQNVKSEFTCASFATPYPIGSQRMFDPRHLIVGTNSAMAFAYDLQTFDRQPLVCFDVTSSTVCAGSGGTYVFFGHDDGKIRLLDGRLRSHGVLHVLEGHSGPIRDMCVQPDGYTVLSCGMMARRVNPYDANSPVNVRPTHPKQLSFRQ